MISILIPVYNSSVIKLVKDLSLQLQQDDLQGEIIVFDDYSDLFYRKQNETLSNLPFVKYRELNRNHGRIEIRKLLAAQSKYNWLLFIDGDCNVIHENYVSNFYKAIHNDLEVFLGGRIYPNNAPLECNKKLHWIYGTKREKNYW